MFCVHGGWRAGEMTAAQRAQVGDANRAAAAIIATRTVKDERVALEWLSRPASYDCAGAVVFSAAQALQLGWADRLGTREGAQAIAQHVANGGALEPSARSILLRQRSHSTAMGDARRIGIDAMREALGRPC